MATDPSTVLSAEGATVAGLFRCPVTHPAHRDSGPTRNFVIAFPRTTGWLIHEGGPPMLITPSMATIYNRGQRYTRKRIAATGDYSDWIGISDASVMRDLVKIIDPRSEEQPDRPLRFPYARIPVELYQRQRMFFTNLRAGNVSPLQAEEEVFSLFHSVMRAMSATWNLDAAAARPRRRVAEDRDRVDAVLSIIGSRFDEPLRLQQLAQVAQLSVPQLCRIFKRETGMSIHSALDDLRLRASLGAVCLRGADLTEVALDLGFSSHSHFSASFRRKFGVTPSQWRRQGVRLTDRSPSRLPHESD